MDDPYLNELRDDFQGYSKQLKKLKTKNQRDRFNLPHLILWP
jgi:hypothetical protein